MHERKAASPTHDRGLLRILACWSALLALLFAVPIYAAAPAFTGAAATGRGALSLINLRAQGVITGTAPVTVRVDGIQVRDRTSPLVNAFAVRLLPLVSSTVCVQVIKPPGQGIEFSQLGVELRLTLFNAEAPGGVSGTVPIETGSSAAGISPIACADLAISAPTADAGSDQIVADTDRQPGEIIRLDGNGSTDTDGRITTYQWMENGQAIATGAAPNVRLSNGSHTLTLIVTDDSGASDSDTININVGASTPGQLPVANAGADRSIADTDQLGGETVTLDGSASRDPDGSIVTYEWLLGQSTVLATGANANVRLPNGVSIVTLRVTDNSGATATDSVTLNVNPAAVIGLPTANAGIDRRVADSDALGGETVTLDGSGSIDTDGTLATYQWLVNNQVIATGATATARLPDGENFITLNVIDNAGNTASDAVLITVAAAATSRPIANAGGDRSLIDTDGREGEEVTLDGTASGGEITSYQWLSGGRELARTATATVRLADGDHVITLVVLDAQGNTAADNVQISVAQPFIPPVLAALPGLTPNQRAVAAALDSLCPRLQAQAVSTNADENDLRARCDGIIRSGTNAQIEALDELSAQDLNAARTQTFNAARSQLGNLSDRLIALRSGARGLSLAGLSLQSDGQSLPLQQLANAFGKPRGGGAAADAVDSLLDKNIGLWLRGNYSSGSKDSGAADSGFDAHQWGLIGGLDYRLSPQNIVGVALGYGRSQADFSPAGSGDLETTAMTGALYGTMYTQRGFYVDAIASYLSAGYDSRRRIVFAEDDALIDVTAAGSTNGGTLGVAFTFGYDVNLGPFTLAPTIGYNYMMSGIDAFREQGAAGLDLEYEKQSYVSATAVGGLRMSFVINTGIGVLIPQLRGEYVREFIRDTQAFGVRFANDPFEDTPLILVSSEEPDQSYMRVAAGFSAQLRYGISGFVEYQKLVGQDLFTYADVALGLRIETSF